MSTSSRQKEGGGHTEVAQSPQDSPIDLQQHPQEEAEEEDSDPSKAKNAIERHSASQEQALGEAGDTEDMQGHPATQEQALAYETEVKEQDRWLPIANGWFRFSPPLPYTLQYA